MLFSSASITTVPVILSAISYQQTLLLNFSIIPFDFSVFASYWSAIKNPFVPSVILSFCRASRQPPFLLRNTSTISIGIYYLEEDN